MVDLTLLDWTLTYALTKQKLSPSLGKMAERDSRLLPSLRFYVCIYHAVCTLLSLLISGSDLILYEEV